MKLWQVKQAAARGELIDLNLITSYLRNQQLRHGISTWLTNTQEQVELLAIKWFPEQPKINPPCSGTILCEHAGRHRRDCMGGMVSVNTFWRKMKKA